MSLSRIESGSPPRFLLLLPPTPTPHTLSTLKSAYGETLSEVLKEVSLHSTENSNKAAVLEIALACSHLVNHHHKPRSTLYPQTQSLLAGLYKLITILATQGNINVEDSDGVDVRIILIDWSPSAPQEPPSQSPYGPIIPLPTLAKSGRTWQFAFGVETDEGEKMVREFVAAKQSTTPQPHTSTEEQQPPSGSASQLHHDVAVGGTWDHLHIGHKLLLTMTLFLVDPRISSNPFSATIGITGDALLVNKKHSNLLQSWSERETSVAVFCNALIDFSPDTRRHVDIRDDPGANGKSVDVRYPNGLVVKCTEIQDPFGPTITEEGISALVISGETRAGGKKVNEKRREKGWRELEVFEVDVLDAEEGEGKEGFEGKLSSTAIREKLAGKM